MTLIWFLVGLLLGTLLIKLYYQQKIGTLSALSEKLIQQAEHKSKTLLQTRENSLREREYEIQREQEKLKSELKKAHDLEKKLRSESTAILKQEKELERIAGLTHKEAREEIIQHEQKALAKQLTHMRAQATDSLEDEATRLILTALTRLSGAEIPEASQTIYPLKTLELKSKIVGKEGRNIRAFEEIAGVTLLIDELPDSIVISCYSPERRFVATRALDSLFSDGRINPERIQETILRVQSNLPTEFYTLGEQAALQVNVHNLSPELLQTLGKLYIRTSFTQNVLAHSVEVAELMGMLAAELQLDEPLARRIGLLHDIGKALPAESNHSHAISGANFAKRHHEKESVVNGIACHHEECPPTSFEAALCKVADTLSASRRGCRPTKARPDRESELEKIARSLPGVHEAFALQAGRELRVIVKPQEVTDEGAEALLHMLSRKIDEESSNAPKVKITIIRENKLVKI